MAEKTDHIAAIQKKYSNIEVQLIESTQKVNQITEENQNLINTIKNLYKDLERLESLKRAVITSIQNDQSDYDVTRKVCELSDLARIHWWFAGMCCPQIHDG